MKRRYLHVAEADAWAAADAEYAPAGLAAEGFIHLCQPGQLAGVLARYYRCRDDLVLLEVDADALEAQIRHEDSTGSGERFPHLYGPLPRAAILREMPLGTDAAGDPLGLAEDLQPRGGDS